VNCPLQCRLITADSSGPKHLTLTLSRAKLEQLVSDLIERTAEPCKQALADANLSADDIDEAVLVGGQTRMPAVQEIVKKLFHKEAHKGVNPDEVVAIGAAIQGGVLAGDAGVKDVLLLDVTPLSLGIETLGAVFTKLIEKNTTIPTKKTQIFSTAADNQTAVSIHVLQGERPMAADNRTLGRFDLIGIPPAPRGIPQIEVSFDIDANGIMHVSAKDLGTGKEQKIKIESSSGLSKEEIEKMKKESEIHAQEDKKKMELIEARNRLDTIIYTSEKSLKEGEGKISSAEKEKVEAAIKKAKEELKSDDAKKMNKAVEELTQASHKLAEELYKKASQQSAAQGAKQQPEAKSNKKEKVVDAEVVDEEKKGGEDEKKRRK